MGPIASTNKLLLHNYSYWVYEKLFFAKYFCNGEYLHKKETTKYKSKINAGQNCLTSKKVQNAF